MCQTNKETRLKTALIEALANPDCYSNPDSIREIKDIQVHSADLYDNDGNTLSDMTVLEDASGGQFTGSVRITRNDESLQGAVSSVYRIIQASFTIKGYNNKRFSIDIIKPVILDK